ncbi:hypothetical protein Mapa_013378 [Marchantia paleacea]|nr:hypothetical protein Mapa_013378 [Marchantia paleacea]
MIDTCGAVVEQVGCTYDTRHKLSESYDRIWWPFRYGMSCRPTVIMSHKYYYVEKYFQVEEKHHVLLGTVSERMHAATHTFRLLGSTLTGLCISVYVCEVQVRAD